MQQQAPRLWLILTIATTGPVCVAWEMTVSPVVAVSRGEDAILNCSFTPSSPSYSGMIRVKWTAREKKRPPFFQCSVKNDSLEGPNPCSFPEVQFSLSGDPRRGDASLLIRSVDLTHNGTIFCGVEVEGRWRGGHLQEKTELYVEVKPRILSLSVVNVSCNPDSSSSAPSWLQCEVEGHPLPTVVWLSASRNMLEDQGQTWQSGESRKTSCVPYEEKQKQVVICRPESRLGHAERSFPSSDVLTIIQISCSLVLLVLLVLLSASVLICCLWRKRRRQVSNPPADGATELQPVYSELSCGSPVVMESSSSRRHHHHQQQEEDYSTVYSLVKAHSTEGLQV